MDQQCQCVQIVGDLLNYERIRMTLDGMVAELEREVEDFETSVLSVSVSITSIAAAERIFKTNGHTQLSLQEVDALKLCLTWYSSIIGNEETASHAIQKRIHDALQSITQSEAEFNSSFSGL